MDGAPGVILVGRRHAEHGDDGIPDELLDHAAVRLHDLLRDVAVAAQKVVDILRVVALRERREAHEVAEQRGDDLALFGRDARSLPRPPGVNAVAHSGQNLNP